VCVCGSDDGGGGVRDILSFLVVEKKHNTKSNCFGLERELNRHPGIEFGETTRTTNVLSSNHHGHRFPFHNEQ